MRIPDFFLASATLAIGLLIVTGVADEQHHETTTDSPAAIAAQPLNNPPTFEIPIYEIVGVGQEVGFGLEVIDAESDLFLVELIEKPDSATFDPYTLTVAFKPTAEDIPQAHFTVRITETIRATNEKRVNTHHFAIEVTTEPQPERIARPLGRSVEQLITIHDPERLAEANARWSLDKLLARNAELFVGELPEGVDRNLAIDGAELYKDFLKAWSLAHKNPELDPGSDKFNASKWGDPKKWKIITVRPRLDKKWHEVRIVLKPPAHEASYAMFKFRPLTELPILPPEARAFNNKSFGEIVLKHFFTEDGKLNPAHTKDKAAHAKATADFLDDILHWKNPDESKTWAVQGVQALPCEARLGGGTLTDENGKILGGDAWAWNVLKPTVDAENKRVKFVNVPIKGFASHVEPNEAGTEWVMSCGNPLFDPESDVYDARMVKLCRPTGHTDLPSTGDGYQDTPEDPTAEIRSSFIDAAHLFYEYKSKHMVSTVALEDPRRDLFEEKGMTCAQCHVRNFGVRDMYDRAAYDPGAGLPRSLNKKQDTTYFVISPTTHWQPYTIDFQYKQECKAHANLLEFTGVDTDLNCPLRVDE
ncbi:MAG: hypothetical protein AAGA58_08520 [Verrucomicrobiota bacterium]